MLVKSTDSGWRQLRFRQSSRLSKFPKMPNATKSEIARFCTCHITSLVLKVLYQQSLCFTPHWQVTRTNQYELCCDFDPSFALSRSILFMSSRAADQVVAVVQIWRAAFIFLIVLILLPPQASHLNCLWCLMQSLNQMSAFLEIICVISGC